MKGCVGDDDRGVIGERACEEKDDPNDDGRQEGDVDDRG